ncbi:prepilin peptidase [Chromohalobacter israelensis]|uniref:Prepilin leader peptidase/N-methyltransferase n=1 Tax=Chromohalobacter israelensis (strain ATCC BAA-138 / DSM 3043 / CIP 106854 / NCIMB 13768 / 1H11) TaxID=290398 RepID=Q1QVI1_CHRI1|nr:type 4 prepilin peptidase 1, Aspartic peptidase, MEROPS family A24A [Chromohalobacter salexigens DSM 3043]PWW41859.1 type 4 prepilin peptidase 1 [Chromohalobacter salexigens]
MLADIPLPWLAVMAFVVGTLLGSFLNVVIVRLPVMLMQQWRQEARESLALETEDVPAYNLCTPRSQCPRCRAPIAWHDNLPLIGWLKRRGRCAHCQGRISAQYPLVELAAGLLLFSVVMVHGATWSALAWGGLCLTLLVVAVIDLRTQLLPDIITLPLLWAGLIYQLVFQPYWLSNAVIGALAGYLLLWGFYWLFKWITGKEGMGYGDFKLLAALGAWFGWTMLPILLILSAGLGAVIGGLLQLTHPRLRGMPLPFGPFLALAGWVAVLFGAPLRALTGL